MRRGNVRVKEKMTTLSKVWLCYSQTLRGTQVHLGKLNSSLPPCCTLLVMETLMLQRFCRPAGHDPLCSGEDRKAGEAERRQQLLHPAWKLLVYEPPAGLIQPLHECVCFHTGPLNSFISCHHGTSSVDKWTPKGWTPDRLIAAEDFNERGAICIKITKKR